MKREVKQKTFLSCGIRTNQLGFPPTGRPLRVWFIWSIWFVLFSELILFNQTNETNQINKTNQINQIDQMNQTSAPSRVYAC